MRPIVSPSHQLLSADASKFELPPHLTTLCCIRLPTSVWAPWLMYQLTSPFSVSPVSPSVRPSLCPSLPPSVIHAPIFLPSFLSHSLISSTPILSPHCLPPLLTPFWLPSLLPLLPTVLALPPFCCLPLPCRPPALSAGRVPAHQLPRHSFQHGATHARPHLLRGAAPRIALPHAGTQVSEGVGWWASECVSE